MLNYAYSLCFMEKMKLFPDEKPQNIGFLAGLTLPILERLGHMASKLKFELIYFAMRETSKETRMVT